ncbi:hypothetical protein EVAR_9987_1 [Eumeta japonica]|uniref:Uncharacterized protein n=1 Tax=Eumeta variegata TaxID=151549 RepID=A0A4C1TR68_EUMVA|nr:hypothetical protein EVAR_9987_1 [Eumeta japonica]
MSGAGAGLRAGGVGAPPTVAVIAPPESEMDALLLGRTAVRSFDHANKYLNWKKIWGGARALFGHGSRWDVDLFGIGIRVRSAPALVRPF